VWLTALFGGFGMLAGVATCVLVPACSLVVLALVLWTLYTRSKQAGFARQSAQSWMATTGQVIASHVETRRTGRSRHEIPRVVYVYAVDGRPYQGQQIRVSDQFLRVQLSGEAHQTVNRYPTDATVTVYYNPANPAESALER
jgi:hypothetical protein